jgi:short-subunit dehydrogenase
MTATPATLATPATQPQRAAVGGDAPPGRALVTGASSGIGAAFAERLARDGHALIIVARRAERLHDLAARLRAETGVAVEVLVADLTSGDGLARVEGALAESADLDMLVNCAGVAGYMPFAELPADDAEALVRLHVVAPTRLTRAALPGMVARGRGAVINVSSGLAFSASLPAPPLPLRAVYASSKSYINTFSEILASELQGTGVRVQALCPGIVRTELHEVAAYVVSHVPFMLEPEDVVGASLAALDLGEVVCVPALADTGVLEEAARARTRVLEGARSAVIAERYLR